MRLLIIFNSFSGKRHKKAKIEYIKNELSKKFSSVDFFSSYEKNSITKEILSRGEEYDAIASLGGDGTAHEVVNAIIKLNKRPKLLVIPLGTCNDFARTIIGKNYKKALNNFDINTTSKIDITKVNNIYMTYAMAFGAATRISYDAKKKSKNIFGKLSYYLFALRLLVGHLERPIINNKRYFIGIITKSKSLAGNRIKNKLYLNDGSFNYRLINNKPRVFGFLSFLFHLWFNSKKSQYLENIDISFDEEVNINIDGENALKTKKISVSIEKEALEVYMYQKYKDKYIK